jgi:hypothetical protein
MPPDPMLLSLACRAFRDLQQGSFWVKRVQNMHML